MDMQEIINVLKGLSHETRTRFKAQVKGVFGSLARGEEKEGSDLDVLVEFMSGATLLDLAGLGLYLEERCGRPVDIVPIDTLRVEMKQRVMEEAILL
jgi:hypothetical protein